MASLIEYKGKKPVLGNRVFIAEGARLIGDVEIGDDSSVFYNAVIRADLAEIRIGKRTNIQDNSCIHTLNGKAPCILGDDVTIGHSVTLHGCEICDGALIGMGATVLDLAIVGRGAIVAAGALVLSKTQIGDGELWGGVPAKFIKKVDPEQAAALNKTYARHYIEYSDWYRTADSDPSNTQNITTSEEYQG